MEDIAAAIRRPGRPRNNDLDVQIRDEAWKLIAEVGCEALTFEAIAQAVGCSRSTLYRRFASRADLIKHLLGETSRDMAPEIRPGMDPRKVLFAHALTCAELMSGHRGTAILNISTTGRRDASVGHALDAHQALVAPHYRAPLHELVPDASDEELDFALHSLMGSIIHHVATRRLPLSNAQIGILVEQAIFLAASQVARRPETDGNTSTSVVTYP